MTAFMTLKKEQSEELPNNNEKILQHYVEKMGDLIAVSDEGVSVNFSGFRGFRQIVQAWYMCLRNAVNSDKYEKYFRNIRQSHNHETCSIAFNKL